MSDQRDGPARVSPAAIVGPAAFVAHALRAQALANPHLCKTVTLYGDEAEAFYRVAMERIPHLYRERADDRAADAAD